MRLPIRFASRLRLKSDSRGNKLLVVRLPPYLPQAAPVFPKIETSPGTVWVGDNEPLEHPEIPRYVTQLAASGRDVFLHTDGCLLRRRVHEFTPSSRFHFVFGFDASDSSKHHDVLEAIRIAKLSGFRVVGIALLASEKKEEMDALAKLFSQFRKLDLDGALILPSEGSSAIFQALRIAKRKFLSRRWIQASDMFAGLALDAVGIFSGRVIRIAATSQPAMCEEGAQA